MVELVDFEPAAHFGALCALLRSRRKKDAERSDLPTIGWMAKTESRAIAFVFLRKIEPNLAFIDGLVTNSHCRPSERHEAIELLLARAEITAQALGIKRLIAHSADKSVLMRAISRGYAPDGGLIVSKEVT